MSKKINNTALNKLMKATKKATEKFDKKKKKASQVIKDRISIEAENKRKIEMKKILSSTGQNIYDINKKKIIDFMISLKNINFEDAKNQLKEQISKYDNPAFINYREISETEIILNLDIYNIFVNIVDYFDKDLFDNLINFIVDRKYSEDLDIMYHLFLENKITYSRLKELKSLKKGRTTPKSRVKNILNVSRKKIKLTDKSENNFSVYINPPWIPYRVENTYINSEDFAILSTIISSYDLDSDKIKEYKRNKYAKNLQESKNIGYDIDMLDKNLILDDAGNKWYKTNKRFFKFFDKISLFRKKQEGDVLTINIEDLFEDFGEYTEIKIKIGYLIDDENFIIQNENIFSKEIEYFRNQIASKEQKMKNILREPLTKSILEMGSNKLFKELKKITNLNQGNQYATDVIEQMSNCETVKEFAEKLADLLVYIDPTVEKIGNKIFKKKLISGYYNPEVLSSLSPSEKLPEIFNDITPAKFQDVVANIINNCKDIFVKNFSLEVYNERYNKINIGELAKVSGIQCENSRNFEEIDPEEIVYFYIEETDKTYCFLIKDLLNQFRNNNFKIYNKSTFETGDDIEFQISENGQWNDGKILDYNTYSNIYTIEYKNQDDEVVNVKKNKNEIRGNDGVFTEKFVENFMRLYGSMIFEEDVQVEKDTEKQNQNLEEDILVPDLLELIEQDINLITGENFKIVKEVESLVQDEIEKEEKEIYEEDEGSVIQKKLGLPKRITNDKLFSKWVEKQRKKNEKKFSTKKKDNNTCEVCTGDSEVVRTVGNNNKTLKLCLKCMEEKDETKSFYNSRN